MGIGQDYVGATHCIADGCFLAFSRHHEPSLASKFYTLDISAQRGGGQYQSRNA